MTPTKARAMEKTSWTDIDSYIAAQPPEVQALLRELRATIQAAAPEATEKISYQIPTFDLNGNLVHFAAFKKHIGFYPGDSGIAEFEGELSGYAYAKGSVQFPLEAPIPLDLVTRITRFRREQNLAKKKKRR